MKKYMNKYLVKLTAYGKAHGEELYSWKEYVEAKTFDVAEEKMLELVQNLSVLNDVEIVGEFYF